MLVFEIINCVRVTTEVRILFTAVSAKISSNGSSCYNAPYKFPQCSVIVLIKPPMLASFSRTSVFADTLVWINSSIYVICGCNSDVKLKCVNCGRLNRKHTTTTSYNTITITITYIACYSIKYPLPSIQMCNCSAECVQCPLWACMSFHFSFSIKYSQLISKTCLHHVEFIVYLFFINPVFFY